MLFKLVLSFIFLTNQPDPCEGKWISIDDETGKEKSEISLYIEGGKLYGRIDALLLEEDQGKLCIACKGKERGKPIVGLVIVKGLTKEGEDWVDGTILDPANGKRYSCNISLDNNKNLNVRGYLGFSLFGRSQVWRPKY